ncbi:MAG: hypothetical protein WBP12_02630 [Candidatus Saccharimonas sp.]
MSVLFADVIKTIDQLDSELSRMLGQLRTTSSDETIANTTRRWPFRLWCRAVQERLISGSGVLTPLGADVVRKLNGGWTDLITAQQVIRSSGLEFETLIAVMTMATKPAEGAVTIASLPAEERDRLWQLGVVDDDWRLTPLGDQVRCDLRWHR